MSTSALTHSLLFFTSLAQHGTSRAVPCRVCGLRVKTPSHAEVWQIRQSLLTRLPAHVPRLNRLYAFHGCLLIGGQFEQLYEGLMGAGAYASQRAARQKDDTSVRSTSWKRSGPSAPHTVASLSPTTAHFRPKGHISH